MRTKKHSGYKNLNTCDIKISTLKTNMPQTDYTARANGFLLIMLLGCEGNGSFSFCFFA